MSALQADVELDADAKSVAFSLLDILNNADGYARPGHPHIAEKAGTHITAVKRGIKALQRRGWFVVEPVFGDGRDRKANRYYPVWERATTGTPPVGSEKERKARRAPLPRTERPSFAFESGPIRLTTAEVADIEQRLGGFAELFFDDLRATDLELSEDEWRDHVNLKLNSWSETEEPAF
ncbi:hypothetical protein ASF24_08225 [Methylobacterium sp. Leaf86]|uniref:hypothetical protein n=1 Tax=Methylobacterium sp. Leaf86 TaxID=1736242 RepID=UPI0007123251|nr:hypothetical protein [Methylobacterium sp. Leaf86]KQO49155.1 hypothetical protein ASF24_08225 [Methylobacterium sp. Leaf86]